MLSDAILIQNWLKSLHALSRNTYNQYEREAGRFLAWLQWSSKKMATCNAPDIDAYFRALQYPPTDDASAFHSRRRKALAESSLHQSRRILGLILSWATQKGHMVHNPLWKISSNELSRRSSHTAAPKSRAIREAVVQAIVAPRSLDESEELLRAMTIAHLAFWSGAASSEIAKLKMADFHKGPGGTFLRLPGPRNASTQSVELPARTRHVVEAYIAHRAKRGEDVGDDAPLVASLRKSKKVSAWTVWHALRSWDFLEESPVAVNPQQFRRAFQEAAVEGGAQEREVAKHLRRRSLPPLSVTPVRLNAKRLQSMVRRTLKDERP